MQSHCTPKIESHRILFQDCRIIQAFVRKKRAVRSQMFSGSGNLACMFRSSAQAQSTRVSTPLSLLCFCPVGTPRFVLCAVSILPALGNDCATHLAQNAPSMFPPGFPYPFKNVSIGVTVAPEARLATRDPKSAKASSSQGRVGESEEDAPAPRCPSCLHTSPRWPRCKCHNPPSCLADTPLYNDPH